jgi:hypothetical protein
MTTLKYAPYNFTGNLTTGNISTISVTSNVVTMTAAVENVFLIPSAPLAAQTFYSVNGSIQYFTSVANTNWIPNFTYSPSVNLNSTLNVGQAITYAILATNGTPVAYYANTANVDGSSSGVTVYWQNGSAPTTGYINGIDSYTYTIIKTSSTPTYTVLATQTRY